MAVELPPFSALSAFFWQPASGSELLRVLTRYIAPYHLLFHVYQSCRAGRQLILRSSLLRNLLLESSLLHSLIVACKKDLPSQQGLVEVLRWLNLRTAYLNFDGMDKQAVMRRQYLATMTEVSWYKDGHAWTRFCLGYAPPNRKIWGLGPRLSWGPHLRYIAPAELDDPLLCRYCWETRADSHDELDHWQTAIEVDVYFCGTWQVLVLTRPCPICVEYYTERNSYKRFKRQRLNRLPKTMFL